MGDLRAGPGRVDVLSADVALDAALLRQVEDDLRALRAAMLAAEEHARDAIGATHPSHRRSAINLVHYVALRRHDVREVQDRLSAIGLSSLGRAEAHVMASIDAVLAVVCALGGTPTPGGTAPVTTEEGRHLLARNADRLLGPAPAHRDTRIMVTMPGGAADDGELIARMVADGMDVARINCAHDDADTWLRLIGRLRGTARPNGHRPRIAMDLGGPKLRTGPLQPGPPVVRVSPRRDAIGRVVSPALVALLPADRTAPGSGAIPVDAASWLTRRVVGERIELTDARGARRWWSVVEVAPDPSDGAPPSIRCVVEVDHTTYVISGTELRCGPATSAPDAAGAVDAARVGTLVPTEASHRVQWGDEVVLVPSLEPAPTSADGGRHVIGCTLPEVFEAVAPGHRVWFDDGKIGGHVRQVTPESVTVVVTDVRPGGAKLKAGKGINLPDTELGIDALTDQDLVDLDVVARHADIVNLSFVRRPADVVRLRDELARRGADDVGIVLKIETAAAFEHLPELLLSAMASRRVGVMIARGDLAIEVGFERLAEVQEEILWLCEAAHVPVVWATQVLDTLARTGHPSRAEVTDAAMGVRSECVMLNKGPHITEAIQALDSILARMQHHQRKKRSLLRRLRAWDHPSVS